MDELLRIEGISKRFGSFYANRDVSLSVAKGEVHTLLGENGAGKSTLMNILIGLYQPNEGSIYLRGKQVQINNPKDAVALGIGMVHQHFMLVEAMTAFENIVLGTRGSSALIDQRLERAQILALSEQYGLDVDLDIPVGELSIGAQQRIEILKVLYRGAELLILDEPTAVLTDMEVEGLFDIIRSLTSEGKAVIFISHKMREVMRISDTVTVLRAGRSVATLSRRETTEAELANLMIGREFKESTYTKVELDDAATNVLRLGNVELNAQSKHGGLSGVSLAVRAGEILGIAGVDGNGQSQLAQIACGLISPDAGEVELLGNRVERFSAQEFIDAGVANVPEDRNRMGLVGDMSVTENLVLKRSTDERFSFKKGAWLKLDAMRAYAQEAQKANDIRCSSLSQPVRDLSGGNQQKVIITRELEGSPKLLVAVHPTRGLDIGATNFVHDAMVAQRDAGCAILLVSADFDEVLKLSDRIAVMFEGKVMGIYPGKNAPVHEISLAMAGKVEGDEE